VILPVFGDDGLVRQYRHAAGKYLLGDLPWTLEDSEDPKLARSVSLKKRSALRRNDRTDYPILRLTRFSDRLRFCHGPHRDKGMHEDDEILTIEPLFSP
jgi:hypothetical protein